MKTNKIKQAFLSYFQKHDHVIIPSSSLVPEHDDTLLFTNSGMVQFKDYFVNPESSPHPRVASSQKCLRAGGKHNDLMEVGRTDRHHTFFEMLGNFSFGDYFKEKAIDLAFNFLTKELELEKDKLLVTVAPKDQESLAIWQKYNLVIQEDRSNFWSMGDTGPCGFCTEIYYRKKDGSYTEIWNIVAMQYNALSNGELEPLAKTCIDTGMGLERIAAVMQGVDSNYDIDIFKHIISKARDLLPQASEVGLRVVADHIRACLFMIEDNITPSNEGRGYVLRKIIRNALTKSQAKEPFLYKLADAVSESMSGHDSFMQLAVTKAIIEDEEKKFYTNIERGESLFDKMIKDHYVSGDVIFKLYDTYGLSLDVIEDIADTRSLQLDMESFNVLLTAHKSLSKSSSKQKIQDMSTSQFVGYHASQTDAIVTGLYDKHNAEVEISVNEGVIVLDQTTFYPEGGGQVSDTGIISSPKGKMFVKDVQKQGSAILHYGLIEGVFSKGDVVTCLVDWNKRVNAARNHTATHLLFAALQKEWEEVQQKGSEVNDLHLRFDFSFSKDQQININQLEDTVNAVIRDNLEVVYEFMTLEQAKAENVCMLEGSKYSEKVRILRIGNVSCEGCIGTHVSRTGDIGSFKILKLSNKAAGIKRIEAVTGQAVIEHLRSLQHILDSLSDLLTVSDYTKISEKFNKLQAQNILQKQRIAKLDNKIFHSTQFTTHVLKDLIIKCAVIDIENADALRRNVMIASTKEPDILFIVGSIGKPGSIIAVISKTSTFNYLEVLKQHLQKSLSGVGGGSGKMIQMTCNFSEDEFYLEVAEYQKSLMN